MKREMRRLVLTLMFFAVPLVSAHAVYGMDEAVEPMAKTVLAPLSTPSRRILIKRISARKEKRVLSGLASWYSASDPGINRHTANGEVFDDHRMTCATWRFPFGTRLKITNVHNGKFVICVVNDRGPAKRLNRVVDLTKGAYRRIADLRTGLVEVSVTPLS